MRLPRWYEVVAVVLLLTMQPDHAVPGAQLTVHGTALLVAVDPAGAESEDPDQPVVSSCDVRIHRQRDSCLDSGVQHGHLLNGGE